MVVSSRLLRAIGVAAGVEHRKAAGAVGRLHHARLEAGLADGRRLLVAGHAANGDGRAEQLGLGRAELGGVVAHLRQQRARHAEDLQQLVVPGAGADIEQQRARGVGRVGRVHAPAGQPPQQEGIDGAEGELAALGARARAGDVVEHPGDLGRREIRVEPQPGLRDDRRLVARRAQRLADVGGAPVLPDDGVVDRLARSRGPR